MKRRNIAGSIVFLALTLLCLAPQAKAESISISEYRQQLQDIAAKVDTLQTHPEAAGELVASIPDQVAVATSSGEITIQYKSLKNNLVAFARAKEEQRADLLREIQTYT